MLLAAKGMEQVIPNGRVWSFPSKINVYREVPPIDPRIVQHVNLFHENMAQITGTQVFAIDFEWNDYAKAIRSKSGIDTTNPKRMAKILGG